MHREPLSAGWRASGAARPPGWWRRLALLAIVVWLVAVPAAAQLRLTLDEAVERALASNPGLRIDREQRAIAAAIEARARAFWDLQFTGEARGRLRSDPVNSLFSGAPDGDLAPRVGSVVASAGLSKRFEGGASLSGTTTVSRDTTTSLFGLLTPSWYTMLGVEFRQPLFQGRRIDPARRTLRVAALDRTRTRHALARSVNETVAAVERAYWTLVAARRDVDVRARALALAEEQHTDTRARIDAGVAPESDAAAPAAEIERRRGDLHASREAVARAEHALKVLMLAGADAPEWDASLEPVDDPATTTTPPSAADGVRLALEKRPELAEAAAALARQDIEIDAARDRLRPVVDLVASYAMRGLAGDPNPDMRAPFPGLVPVILPEQDGGLFRSWATAFEQELTDASVGVQVGIPIGHRAARADLALAEASRRQAAAALAQAELRVAADVRNAVASLDAGLARITASRAGLAAAREQLRAEQERFAAGITTPFFVLTRQNDLAHAELAEVAALVDYRRALVEYARATGTLADMRGIDIDTDGPDRAGETPR